MRFSLGFNEKEKKADMLLSHFLSLQRKEKRNHGNPVLEFIVLIFIKREFVVSRILISHNLKLCFKHFERSNKRNLSLKTL